MAKLAFASLLLWAITVAGAAFLYINGLTARGLDDRQIILLSQSEREHVLEEMRGLLDTVAQITAALARPDNATVARIAGNAGSKGMSGESPALIAKLPIDFRTGGANMHANFDQMAAAARGGASQARMTTMLSEQLSGCVACHASYRMAN